jgi:hypothetical protein
MKWVQGNWRWAALNLFAGIYVGCMMYYWFNRLGVPGFKYARIQK